MTMHKAWVLLRTMSAQLKGAVSIPDRTMALVMGARAFLEQSYQQYIRSRLQERRSQVLQLDCTVLLLLLAAFLPCLPACLPADSLACMCACWCACFRVCLPAC